jgi:predicted ATPase/DNA-binding SARP family transcriptional activator
VSGGARVSVEVLGRLRVRDASGADLTLTGALQRRLLALLVLRRGHPVSMDVAIDALWPEDPPRDPVAAIHNHVSRLRSLLPEGAIEWQGDAYQLDPAAASIDVDALSSALAADPDDPEAERVVDEVLARWQGQAYPELDGVDAAIGEIARLDELRFRALEDRAARRLAAGRLDGLVAELQTLIDQAPLRERPRELLLDALAAGGRVADALRAYDDFRRLLGDELGIEPSPALAARHAELLAGDARHAWTPADRLPVPPTRLLGRDVLLDAALAAVDAQRLVTLIGPGGVGKTRLSLELGHHLRASRPDRPVVFCELATATPESAHDVVAAALAISPRPGVTALERVCAALPGVEVVVVLDNCEHVLESIAVLAERVLAECPDVRLLATSRERLRIAGEQLLTVPTLELGAVGSPAVQLFVERAQAVSPGFEPEDDEAAAIEEIVARLDGLPLAIELAASRLQTYDVAEVRAGLDERLSLLSSGSRTSSRHGSLTAAVAWSFDLLDEGLQRAFADLSTFAAPFSVNAAAHVTGSDPAFARRALDELVERSLLVRRPDRRYVLLESLRAFGAERLAATGRSEEVADRHADRQIAWLLGRVGRLGIPGNRALLDIEEGLPDLRAALGFLVERGDAERAGRLVAGLFDFGFLRLRPDVLAWTRRVIDLDPEDRYPGAGAVRAVAGYAAWMEGDVDRLGDDAARAQAAIEGDPHPQPEVAGAWASHALFEGRLAESLQWYQRGAELSVGDPARCQLYEGSALLARAYAGDPETGMVAQALLDEVGEVETPYGAYIWYCAGEADLGVDTERALARYATALRLAQATGATLVEGLAGTSKASIEARVGDVEVATEDYRRLLEQWRRAGMWAAQWTMLRAVAGLLERLGKHRDAAVLVGAVLSTASGHRIFGADAEALRELTQRLRETLGEEELAAALAAGATLDGDAAVEHARRAL